MTTIKTTKRLFLISLCALLLIPTLPALARIKLITLPVRERVEIQLDNPNATLVEEERIVPLVKGVNQIDFSWANTRIDPNTILFRVIPSNQSPQLNVQVLSVSYPPNENALIWQVSSTNFGSARVRISYLLHNLTKTFNYRAVASHDEKTLDLNQYIRVNNLANEAFSSTGLWAGFGEHFLKPIGINETKEMLMTQYTAIPVKKTYTCNPAEFDYLDRPQNKLRVPMHYVIKNDKSAAMGDTPLQFGKVRIFQKDAHNTTAFIGEDWGKFTPIDDEMKLYLGLAKDIVVKRTIEQNNKKRITGNLYDIDIIIKYEIENFKNLPVTLDVAENIDHIRNELLSHSNRDTQWELGSQTTFHQSLDKDKSTHNKAFFHANLPPKPKNDKAQKTIHKFHLIIKNYWQ